MFWREPRLSPEVEPPYCTKDKCMPSKVKLAGARIAAGIFLQSLPLSPSCRSSSPSSNSSASLSSLHSPDSYLSVFLGLLTNIEDRFELPKEYSYGTMSTALMLYKHKIRLTQIFKYKCSVLVRSTDEDTLLLFTAES